MKNLVIPNRERIIKIAKLEFVFTKKKILTQQYKNYSTSTQLDFRSTNERGKFFRVIGIAKSQSQEYENSMTRNKCHVTKI